MRDGHGVTLREYLNSSYNPDYDFVDDHLEERNLGELDHGKLQGRMVLLLNMRAAEWGIEVFPEVRLQTQPTRFRIPDVMVLRAGRGVTRIVRGAPLLCVEVLSSSDNWGRLKDRVQEYLAMGVGAVWALDPETREAFLCDENGFNKTEGPDLAVEGTAIRLTLAEIFA